MTPLLSRRSGKPDQDLLQPLPLRLQRDANGREKGAHRRQRELQGLMFQDGNRQVREPIHHRKDHLERRQDHKEFGNRNRCSLLTRKLWRLNGLETLK